jgi:hypothetical protein
MPIHTSETCVTLHRYNIHSNAALVERSTAKIMFRPIIPFGLPW